LRRADAKELFECSREVAFISYAHLVHYLFHSQASSFEKFLRLLHSESQNILRDGSASSDLEQTAQVPGRNVYGLCYLVERKLPIAVSFNKAECKFYSMVNNFSVGGHHCFVPILLDTFSAEHTHVRERGVAARIKIPKLFFGESDRPD
jgi:hypothetical protein